MKKRKLFYVPGLISIIGLPVLLFFMGPKDKVYERVIRLNLPTDKKDTPGILTFSREGFYRSIKGKKIISIDMEEPQYSIPDYDEQANYRMDRKFHFITREVERMQFTHDTSTILAACLGAVNTYGDLIRLINHARLYNMKRYVYVDDCMFFLANPPPVHYKENIEPLDVQVFDIPPSPQPAKWDVFKRWLKETCTDATFVIRHNYVLTASFLLLILLPGGLWLMKSFLVKGHEQ